MTTWVIGDLHGHHDEYLAVLRNTGLIDDRERWSGGDDTLWLMGDFFDRGDAGVDCVETTMRLQVEAARSGGKVDSLLGNHEVMILAAWEFRDALTSRGMKVRDQWLRWGGVAHELDQLTDEHVDWLRNLPALTVVGDSLLMHADAMFYIEFGHTIDAVNENMRSLLYSGDLHRIENCLASFAEHEAFCYPRSMGADKASQVAELFGCKRIVHGHTPIPYACQIEPREVDHAWVYADGRCINVDGGIFMGSPGFAHRLED